MTEYLTIVDENDNIIGKADWDTVRIKNLWHRGSSIFIFNSKKELFVHKRSKRMKKYPSLYAVFVGGGVSAGESYEENAARELEEETGIKGVTLYYLFKTKFEVPGIRAINKVFSCLYDGAIKLQEQEVEKGFFISLTKLNQMLKQETFSPPNILIYKEYIQKYHEKNPAIKGL